MKITVIGVGKVKERFFEEAIKEYQKRLGRYCRLEIIQVGDEKTPDGAGLALEDQIRDREGQRILSHIKDGAYVIALAIEGRMLDSEELAKKIENLGVQDDISPSAYESDSVGADLPGLPDPEP